MVEVQITYWADQRTATINEFVGSGDPPTDPATDPTATTDSAAGLYIHIIITSACSYIIIRARVYDIIPLLVVYRLDTRCILSCFRLYRCIHLSAESPVYYLGCTAAMNFCYLAVILYNYCYRCLKTGAQRGNKIRARRRYACIV